MLCVTPQKPWGRLQIGFPGHPACPHQLSKSRHSSTFNLPKYSKEWVVEEHFTEGLELTRLQFREAFPCLLAWLFQRVPAPKADLLSWHSPNPLGPTQPLTLQVSSLSPSAPGMGTRPACLQHQMTEIEASLTRSQRSLESSNH